MTVAITLPKRRIVRIGDDDKPSKDDLWFVVELKEDGTWEEISKGYPHSTSAFAALGRRTQKDVLANSNIKPDVKKFYFTFGDGHQHEVSGFYFDKDVLLEIEAADSHDARQQMFGAFGDKWAMQYDSPIAAGLQFYRRGVVDLNGREIRE